MDFNFLNKDTKSLHLLTSKDIYEAFLLNRKSGLLQKNTAGLDKRDFDYHWQYIG